MWSDHIWPSEKVLLSQRTWVCLWRTQEACQCLWWPYMVILKILLENLHQIVLKAADWRTCRTEWKCLKQHKKQSKKTPKNPQTLNFWTEHHKSNRTLSYSRSAFAFVSPDDRKHKYREIMKTMKSHSHPAKQLAFIWLPRWLQLTFRVSCLLDLSTVLSIHSKTSKSQIKQ